MCCSADSKQNYILKMAIVVFNLFLSLLVNERLTLSSVVFFLLHLVP